VVPDVVPDVVPVVVAVVVAVAVVLAVVVAVVVAVDVAVVVVVPVVASAPASVPLMSVTPRIEVHALGRKRATSAPVTTRRVLLVPRRAFIWNPPCKPETRHS